MLEREILCYAQQLIEREPHWTSSASAREKSGIKIAPDHPNACCWCVIGAVERAIADMSADEAVLWKIIARLGNSAETLFGTRGLNFINDRWGHQAVRQLFDHALAQYAIIEAAGVDDGSTEIERLRNVLGFCLGRIDELEHMLTMPKASCIPFARLL